MSSPCAAASAPLATARTPATVSVPRAVVADVLVHFAVFRPPIMCLLASVLRPTNVQFVVRKIYVARVLSLVTHERVVVSSTTLDLIISAPYSAIGHVFVAR